MQPGQGELKRILNPVLTQEQAQQAYNNPPKQKESGAHAGHTQEVRLLSWYTCMLVQGCLRRRLQVQAAVRDLVYAISKELRKKMLLICWLNCLNSNQVKGIHIYGVISGLVFFFVCTYVNIVHLCLRG